MNKPFKKPAYPGDKILDKNKIREVVGAADSTIYKWWGNGVLPKVKIGGMSGSWESDVLELIQPKTAA